MKKNYSSPTSIVINLELEQLIAASGSINDGNVHGATSARRSSNIWGDSSSDGESNIWK